MTLQVVPLSAGTPEGVEQAVSRLTAHLRRHPGQALENIAYTYQVGRAFLDHRAVLYAHDAAGLASACETFDPSVIVRAMPIDAPVRCAFAFSGQGGVFAGMGRGLRRFRAFRDAVDAVDDVLSRGAPAPVSAMIEGTAPPTDLSETHLTQRVLFGFQLGLAALWEALGYSPNIVVGHSVGELAAAVAAKIIDARAAAEFVTARADLTAACPRGLLVSVAASDAQLAPLLADNPEVEIALLNAPERIVLGGPRSAVTALCDAATARGLSSKPLAMSHAFHTSLMATAVPGVRVAASRLVFSRAAIPLVRGHDGALVHELDAAELASAVATCNRFSTAACTLARSQPDVVIEIGPGQNTLGLLTRSGVRALKLPSVDSQEAPPSTLTRALGTLFLSGRPAPFDRLSEGRSPCRVHVPQTPLARRAVSVATDRAGPPRLPASASPRASSSRDALAAAWVQVLGRAPDDSSDFFAEGGDSLAAIQLISRLPRDISRSLSFEHVFQLRRFGALRAAMDAATSTAGLTASAIPRVPDAEDHAVTALQERMYVLSQLAGAESAYHLETLVSICFEQDVERIAAGLREVSARHDALRTTFHMRDDLLRSVVHASLPPIIDVIDAPGSRRDPATVESLAAHLRDRVRANFDLAHGPLWRVTLVRWPDSDPLMLVVVHHLIFDGYSMNVLLRDLRRACRGELAAQPAPLRWLDVAAWQGSPRMPSAESYFEGVLDKQRLSVALPTARSRTVRVDRRAARVRRLIDETVVEGLRGLGRTEGATLFMSLLTVYTSMLGELTEQTDVTVATPVAFRDTPEFMDVVGPLINTIPVRSTWSTDSTWRQRLARVREGVIGALGNATADLSRIASALGAERSPQQSPPFNVWFALQTIVENAQRGAKLREEFHLDPELGRFELLLQALETPAGLQLELEYMSSLFDEAQVDGWLQRFVELLHDMQRSPDAVPRPARATRRRIAGPHVAPTWSLLSRVDEVIRHNPDATAVERGALAVTYAELDRIAGGLVERLAARGVAAGDRVMIDAPRSVGFVATALATMRLGAAYVPVDPTWPESRRAFVLGDAAPKVVVSDRSSAGAIVVPADEALATWCAPGRWRGEEPRPSAAAYIIYTSGSTGQPKGVVVTHGGLQNYLDHCITTYRGHGGRGALLHSSLAYDMSVTSLWLPLLTGEAVIIVDGEGARGLVSLHQQLTTRRVRLLKLTPTHLEALAEAFHDGQQPLVDVLVVGGEQLYFRQLRTWPSQVRVFNEYGPTEATVGCVVHEVHDRRNDGVVPIGLPIQNVMLELEGTSADSTLRIGGIAVASGYWNHPELTRERFESRGEGDETVRLYHSGDHVQQDAEGRLVFVGRVDDQVKVRGHRVELGEIEASLRSVEGVQQAAVVLERGSLVAHIVTSIPGLTGAHLLEAMRSRVPEYAIPSEIRFWPALPRTENGKLDRAALRASEPGAGRPDDAENELEAIIAATFRAVLKQPDLTVEDSFFLRGGTSLSLFAVLLRLRRHIPSLDLQDLFEAPIPRVLARRVGSAGTVSSVKSTAGSVSTANPPHGQAPSIAPGRGRGPHVVVTGANGFLGIHVIDELTRTGAVVTAVVRGRDASDATARFATSWCHYLGADGPPGSVRVAAGDVVGASLFDGEPPSEPPITGVIHAAADVRHFGDRLTIDSVNVQGSRNAIAFAHQHRARIVHVSTLSVLGQQASDSGDLVLHEDDEHHLLADSANVYIRSKILAENVAREWTGAAVVRTGNLVPSWPNGRFRPDVERSAFYRMIRSWILTGMAPDRLVGGALLDLTPVDFAAQVVVSALCSSASRRIFHAVHPGAYSVSEFCTALTELGYRIEVLPRADYLEQLQRRATQGDTGEGLELAALHVGRTVTADRVTSTRYDAAQTVTALQLPSPRIAGGALIRHVVSVGVASGYLPRPVRGDDDVRRFEDEPGPTQRPRATVLGSRS